MAERQIATDEELMNLVQAGGRDGLSTLMRRYANPLLTFLRRMTGDHHRSEELFQDVFLAVWTQRAEYGPWRPFRAWLFGIASNKCRSEVRSRQRRPMIFDGEQTAAVAQDGATPSEAAVATETATIVEEAVLRLPHVQRQVVVLRVWNALSYQAIGQVVGCSEGTARSHMFHALTAMRVFLEPRLRDRDA
ncbi:MAG TPA: RNA polymerase sigma factor [Planctomycetaceae bacterium]|nr:RNA polymerase sigma factor [Planctomycetaceae bacterium]